MQLTELFLVVADREPASFAYHCLVIDAYLIVNQFSIKNLNVFDGIQTTIFLVRMLLSSNDQFHHCHWSANHRDNPIGRHDHHAVYLE